MELGGPLDRPGHALILDDRLDVSLRAVVLDRNPVDTDDRDVHEVFDVETSHGGDEVRCSSDVDLVRRPDVRGTVNNDLDIGHCGPKAGEPSEVTGTQLDVASVRRA